MRVQLHTHDTTIKIFVVGPKQTWLNSNICSNERTFEYSLSNSNFSIISMQKCALISKVEKWHSYLVAHFSSASVMSESVSMIEKIVENNKKSKIEIVFADSH